MRARCIAQRVVGLGSFETLRGGSSTAQLKSGATNSWGKPNPRRAEIFAPPDLPAETHPSPNTHLTPDLLDSGSMLPLLELLVLLVLLELPLLPLAHPPIES